jgi:hypothetical protein
MPYFPGCYAFSVAGHDNDEVRVLSKRIDSSVGMPLPYLVSGLPLTVLQGKHSL